ncbi:MAG: hypothetical protein LBP59_13010 [Planctomycetaceae bacterium]|jgi:hypothetical protein|nr:hypothetical protein [Planctomycetaceae bacterium]
MLKNIIKKMMNVFGQVNDNPQRNVRRVMRRKLGFEVLEGRELLSAGSLDDNFYDNTFEDETFYSNDYYESGSVSGYSESNTYDEFDQNYENTMFDGKDECCTVSLFGPTAINGLTPTFAEATQDTFNVTISRIGSPFDIDTDEAVDFLLLFGGTASKNDFMIYEGNNLISDNAESWLYGNTTFLYTIPSGSTAITLTFKIVDNQFIESDTESLTISAVNVPLDNIIDYCECCTDTISVTIINDSCNVKWQTISGTNDNKAALSADPNSSGQRVFPEKSTPNGVIENQFELVFKLEVAVTTNTTLYFKIFDPDNFIGLGNNDNNASSWAGGDNYATSSITTGSITIAAGATNKALTVVVYPAGYNNVPETVPANTIFITSAHVGDNFIVVVDTDQTKINNTAALGTTKDTRYKETHNYAQTELLTVWRTLNVELDVATWTGMPAGDFKAPINGFVKSELAKACIAVKEFTANNTNAPNIGNSISDEDALTLMGGNPTQNSGRDIGANTADYWATRVITSTSYRKSTGSFMTSPQAPDAIVLIRYTTIVSAVDTWNTRYGTNLTVNEVMRRTVLHELCHVLTNGTEHKVTYDTNGQITDVNGVAIIPNNTNTSAIEAEMGVRSTIYRLEQVNNELLKYTDIARNYNYNKLLTTDIKEIQSFSKARSQ